MTHELLVASFGGQGVMAIGKLIAQAAVAQGMNATWLPSYGAEVRGGVANCCCVLSEEEVVTPVVTEPNELIVMNELSFCKYVPIAPPDSMVLVNSSIVSRRVERRGRTIYVPCNDVANELGYPKTANMVMVGAYAAAAGFLEMGTVRNLLRELFHGPKERLAAVNEKALQAGAGCV